jgi:hypothetical protein
LAKSFPAGTLRFLLSLICFVQICVGMVAEAESATDQADMYFVVVRGASRLCQPKCPEWISAEGRITSDTPNKLKRLLKSIGNRRLPIILTSPGGDVDGAVATGRLIRKAGLDVAIGQTTFISCRPDDRTCKAEKNGGYVGIPMDGWGFCESACPFILSGGSTRLVGNWATLSVHQITTTFFRDEIVYKTRYKIVDGKKKAVGKKKIVGRKRIETHTTTKIPKALRRKLESYLTEMGVGLEILKYLQTTPPKDLLMLSKAEMLDMRLITGLESLKSLTFLMVCQSALDDDC